MTLRLGDLIKETTTTSGTGPLTLLGAATGCRAFSSICSDGDTVPYTIGEPGSAEREVGIGTWNTGNLLTRTAILESTNGNSVVSLSAGTKTVYLSFPAELVGIARSGSTVPTSPQEGLHFLHTPTGRTVMLIYAGGAWRSVASYGSMTLFVDGALGTNATDKGFGTGANAYATVQYAIDSIPASVGGNITVAIAAGTYAENVVIQGKSFTGAYSITLTGVRTTLDTLTSSASTQGSGATQGTVVRSSGTWTSNQRANKMVRFTAGVNSGLTRIIDSNTTTTLTICETWSGGAPGTDAFVVEDWGTIIQPATGIAIDVAAGQTGIVLVDLSLVGAATWAALYVETNSVATITTSTITNAAGSVTPGTIVVLGVLTADTCFFTNSVTGDRVVLVSNGNFGILRSKLMSGGINSYYALLIQGGSLCNIQSGCVIDANGGERGIEVEASVAYAYTPNSHTKVRGGTLYGLNASFGATVFYSASGVYVDFSGNGTNTNADAATYSSIS